MAIDILEDPFSDSAVLDVSESAIRHAAPSMPDTKVQDLLRAAGREQWDKQQGVNEQFLFGQEYLSTASHMSAELGPFTMEPFEALQPVAEAATLRLINEGDRTGSFRGQNAAGGSQWDIEGLNTNTFGGDASDRVYQTGKSGDVDLIPGVATGDGAEITDSELDSYNPDEDTQAILIMGYYASTNPRAVEHVHLGIDDGERRTAHEAYSHQTLGSLRAFESPSVEYVTDDDELDINISATSDTSSDFFPYGIELNTAANLKSLDPGA